MNYVGLLWHNEKDLERLRSGERGQNREIFYLISVGNESSDRLLDGFHENKAGEVLPIDVTAAPPL